MPGPSGFAQRRAVKSFCEMMHTTEEVAISCLSVVGYDVEEAIDHYYQHEHLYGDQHVRRCDEATARHLFERYANDPLDGLPDRIGPNGVSRLLDDLSLDAEDRKVLVLASKMEAQVMCEFSLAEWLKGMKALGADSINSLRARLDEIDQELFKSSEFKPVYQFTFGYGKKAGQRNLDLDIALIYWRILFQDQFPLLSLWEEYITAQGKPVTRDTWNLLAEFATTVSKDLSDFDEDGAWPVVLDHFVAWARPRVSGN